MRLGIDVNRHKVGQEFIPYIFSLWLNPSAMYRRNPFSVSQDLRTRQDLPGKKSHG